MEFQTDSGLRVSVGKNNSQNDLLTTRQAGKGDLWFHTQKLHGSHVILWSRGEEPDEGSIVQAAMLAAWFSQGREAGKIPVDYTRRSQTGHGGLHHLPDPDGPAGRRFGQAASGQVKITKI